MPFELIYPGFRSHYGCAKKIGSLNRTRTYGGEDLLEAVVVLELHDDLVQLARPDTVLVTDS